MVRHPPRIRKVCRAPGPGTRVITARRPIPRPVCTNHGYPYPLMVHLWARTGEQGREPVHVGFYCWRCHTLVPDDGVLIPLGDSELNQALKIGRKHDRARALCSRPADTDLEALRGRHWI